MQTTNAHLTSTDFHKIEILVLLVYSWQKATEAYLSCDRDVTKASDLLDTHKKFNSKVQAHLSNLMDSAPGSDTLFALGDDFALVEYIHDYYDLDSELDHIKKDDIQSVT